MKSIKERHLTIENVIIPIIGIVIKILQKIGSYSPILVAVKIIENDGKLFNCKLYGFKSKHIQLGHYKIIYNCRHLYMLKEYEIFGEHRNIKALNYTCGTLKYINT